MYERERERERERETEREHYSVRKLDKLNHILLIFIYKFLNS